MPHSSLALITRELPLFAVVVLAQQLLIDGGFVTF